MKYIELSDSQTGQPVYINVDAVNAIYTDVDMRCTAVDVQSGVLFVNEDARTILNTLYEANYDQGFLFKAPLKKDGD